MAEQQMSLFAVAEETNVEEKSVAVSSIQSEQSETKALQQNQKEHHMSVQEVRSSAQKNRKFAYDVGEEIGGAKKHLAALRRKFECSHDIHTLTELEDHDQATAIELITKEELFKSFSLHTEKEKGTEPHVARFKQLMIRRIDKYPSDSKKHRESYLNAAKCLLEVMEHVRDDEHLRHFIQKLNKLLAYEKRGEAFQERLEEKIEFGSEALLNLHWQDPQYQKTLEEVNDCRKKFQMYEEAVDKQYSALGHSFAKLFTSQKSLNTTVNNACKIQTWDELLKPKSKTGKKTNRRQTWKRDLPERPDRQGGVDVNLSTPEEMVTTFGFKGGQFGHYVSDHKAQEHIIRSSESLMDLSDILNVSPAFFSLEGTLALAFGARGSGAALGHYEPLHKVINFTKTKGTLGILAHEWFHALDNFIGTKDTSKMKTYLSDHDSLNYDWIHLDIRTQMKELLSAIKDGVTTEDMRNENGKHISWRVDTATEELYNSFCDNGELDLEGVSKAAFDEIESRKEKRIQFYTYLEEKDIKRIIKKYDRNYKNMLQAILWIYEQREGKRIESIPAYINRSSFYQQSINLDRGKKGKYFSSDREMVARCFEAYIQDTIESLERRNDYLVAGTKDPMAYPQGEQRQLINQEMNKLIELIKEYFPIH